MKAGTAQKLVLNMISTTAMIEETEPLTYNLAVTNVTCYGDATGGLSQTGHLTAGEQEAAAASYLLGALWRNPGVGHFLSAIYVAL